MYPLELLIIEHKRRMYLEIWNQRQIPAQVDDGDLQPGASAAIVMPLVVANDAPSGVQAQAFTGSHRQDGETRDERQHLAEC